MVLCFASWISKETYCMDTHTTHRDAHETHLTKARAHSSRHRVRHSQTRPEPRTRAHTRGRMLPGEYNAHSGGEQPHESQSASQQL
eukprot:2807011-Prymnesium_polylepis.1